MAITKKKPWWWLSFADGTKPTGSQWLGGAYVQGDDIVEATRIAHFLGINPGGEVQGAELPESIQLPDEAINRLLSKTDMERLEMEPIHWKDNDDEHQSI